MKYLLDTCVISELVKKEPNQNVVDWIKSVDEDFLYLSVLTIGEIQKGISKLANSSRKLKLENWLYNDLRKRFHNRILEIDEDTVIEWGKISGNSERKGRKIPVIDALISATSIINGCILVSRNEADFKNTGCDIFNPWT